MSKILYTFGPRVDGPILGKLYQIMRVISMGKLRYVIGAYGGGFGDVFMLGLACYLHAQEKGYSGKDVYIPFVEFGYETKKWRFNPVEIYNQQTTYLPWTWVSNVQPFYSFFLRNPPIQFDEVIDLNKKDVLYPGYPGIRPSWWYLYNYFDMYYHNTGKLPYLDVPRDYKGKPYIIFQWRDAHRGLGTHKGGNYKNSTIEEFEHLYDLVTDHFGTKYEYWKMGEPCPIDNQFDELIPMLYDNHDKFMQIIRNASLMVAPLSGPAVMIHFIDDLPIIRYSIHHNPADTMIPDTWKSHIHLVRDDRFNHHPSWGNEKIFTWRPHKKNEEVLEFLNQMKL